MWIVAPLAAVVAGIALLFGAGYFFFEDIAPDRFDVGAELRSDGEIAFLIGDCMGGELKSIALAIDASDGDEPPRTHLWAVARASGSGVSLTPGKILEVQFGDVPPGMVATAPVATPPLGQRLQLDVDTTLQSFAFFFQRDELEEGKVWAGSHGLVTREQFQSLVDDLCDI